VVSEVSVVVGSLTSSDVQFDGFSGHRSSWTQQALGLMEPTGFHDAVHPSVLSPLSPLVSPASQAHSDKVVYQLTLHIFSIMLWSAEPCIAIEFVSDVVYRIYSHISRKIYDKILPEKLGGDLYRGHKIKKFFPAAKIFNFLSDVPHRRCCRDDKFDDDDAVYNDDGEDYADLLHLVQVLRNHLRLIYGSMILDHIRTQFLGGNLYSGATYMRVYTVIWWRWELKKLIADWKWSMWWVL